MIRSLALAAALAALPAAAGFNHVETVPPFTAGPFKVACSNIEQDALAMSQSGDGVEEFWEGRAGRYIDDVLVHRETAVRFDALVPDIRAIYPQNAGDTVPFVALVCHPTSRENADPPYVLPGTGDLVPHMQPPGAAPRLISSDEHLITLGLVPGRTAGPARLPLVLYSHGAAGSPTGGGYLETLVALASNGYIVAAPFHGDGRFSRLSIEDLGDVWYFFARFDYIVEMQLMRPLSLKALVDTLLAHPGFAPGIDTERIAGFGASLGGEAMAHLLGARITSSLFGGCSETVRDSRLKAAVGYVPYFGQDWLPALCTDQRGADDVERPFLAIAGGADATSHFVRIEQAVRRFRGSRYLVELQGGEHELRPEHVGDVLAWTVNFLAAHLAVPSDPGAAARFIRMAEVQGGAADRLLLDVHVPAFPPPPDEIHVVEFYNVHTNHYFLTASFDEVQAILAGSAGPGWLATGERFKAWWRTPPDAMSLVAPVCRFYSDGANSHFFTVDPPECEAVKRNLDWRYEGIGFHIVPAGAGRRCPDGLLAVNRAYNNGWMRNDNNHRYSTSDSTLRSMIAQGWTFEDTVMCSPP